jgi:hypothetical protein
VEGLPQKSPLCSDANVPLVPARCNSISATTGSGSGGEQRSTISKQLGEFGSTNQLSAAKCVIRMVPVALERN